ncbi:hypothetical protein BKA60DRAFT_640278 [Fusarium oxysporum]|nr:hypothetical protein BKA60DRAFT_640278 [Fusarium oxysporum]
MFDDMGCGGDGGHTFCCPAGSSKMPTCGWYGHNNGRCPTRSECPSDMTEIASNEIDCKKKGSKKQNFQTACCKTDVVGTKVYGKMGSLLAYSASGSGGGNCDNAKNELGLNVPGVQYRKFCCNDSDKNLRFTDCKKFRDVGPVAIDTQVDTCAIAKENPKIDAFENDLKAWIKKPTCTNKKFFLSRHTLLLDEVVSNSPLSTDLISRATKDDTQLAFNIQLARMIAASLAKPLLETLVEKWNNAVKDNYP